MVKRMSEQTWKRWRLLYLSNLQNRHKWNKATDNPKKGDLVILREDNSPALQWPTGIITEVFKGKDGVI